MCGRYYVDEETVGEIERVVREVDEKLRGGRTGDVFPSQPAAVLTGKVPGMKAEMMKWGFLQNHKNGLLINARAETCLERRTFRDSVLHRRCIIPAKRFYEWDSRKNKVAFSKKNMPVLYMAGFYNVFQGEERFIILTTQANASVASVHDRMPLLMEARELEDWIYDDSFLEFALCKTPALLEGMRDYEQLSLF